MKLTKENVARIKPEPGKDRVFMDDADKGFGLRIFPSGKMQWFVQYRVGVAQHRDKVGPAGGGRAGGVVSAEQARAEARKRLAMVHLGGDPQADKRAARARDALTFGAVADRFLAATRKKVEAGDLRPRSLQAIEGHLANHWAPFNALPVHSIERRTVAARLVKIADEAGLYAANRARSTLSALFAWAIGAGEEIDNPVIGTNKPLKSEPARDRTLADAELVAIWKACRDDDYGRIVRLLILTGQRRDEVGSMALGEIDEAGRKWSIPAARTKNGRPHDVPLSDLALAIVGAAKARERLGERDLVFGEGGGGFSGWSAAKDRLDKRIAAAGAKVAPWRLHDLRRTAATRMGDVGVLPHVVEAVLSHVSGHKAGVAGVYNLAAYAKEKRQALDLWAAHIEALLAGKSASNVVTLRAS